MYMCTHTHNYVVDRLIPPALWSGDAASSPTAACCHPSGLWGQKESEGIRCAFVKWPISICATIQMVNCSVSTLHYTWRQPQPQDGVAIMPASGSIGNCTHKLLRQLGPFPTDYFIIVCVPSGWWRCLLWGGDSEEDRGGVFPLPYLWHTAQLSPSNTPPPWLDRGGGILCQQNLLVHTCSVCMYYGSPGTTDQCGLFQFAVWTGSNGHLLLTHLHSHQSHQHLCHSGNETSCEGRRCTRTWRGWRETDYCGMDMYMYVCMCNTSSKYAYTHIWMM